MQNTEDFLLRKNKPTKNPASEHSFRNTGQAPSRVWVGLCLAVWEEKAFPPRLPDVHDLSVEWGQTGTGSDPLKIDFCPTWRCSSEPSGCLKSLGVCYTQDIAAVAVLSFPPALWSGSSSGEMEVLSLGRSSGAGSLLHALIIFFQALRVPGLDSARFTVVGPGHPVTAMVGEEIVLPCRLFPSMSAENMEVRWFRSEFTSFVHLYRRGKDEFGQQMPEYHGRTELLKASLTDGNVALKIVNVRRSDEGQYRCSVQDGVFHVEAELELKITDVSSPGAVPWIVVWIVTLVILLVFIGLTLFLLKLRGKYLHLISKLLRELEWRRCLIDADNVTLDEDTAHVLLKLSEDGKCLQWGYDVQSRPDIPERFDVDPCVLGNERFTSGRHSWEVDVGNGHNWAVGVAKESVSRKGGISMTPEGGIWAVQRSGSNCWALTDYVTPLLLSQIPRRVRVCLDCDRGQVVFTNADTENLIYVFPPGSLPQERIRPWLGVWDMCPLRLCH
ncbi:butyrophilin subfamily 1 member A1-like isoform X1 [Pelodiscus sinensis]|uniref:butyrophilin subfamily 1 member A1-like isoform X1 n=2 Tax=Pelodiscus sinensis TaxID=13735 RepID=UPI003F6ACC3C